MNRNSRDRKSPRLKGWDYRTPAWYFVTICTKDRQYFFGKIRNGMMSLSETGNIAYQNWAAIPDHFDHVALGEWIVMPNHFHGLIGIMEWPVKNNIPVGTRNFASPQNCKLDQLSNNNQTNEFGPLKSGSLSAIIQAYKSSVTRWARKNNRADFAWQSRYHDHIVRNSSSLSRIREYIYNNPLQWESDRLYESE